MVPKDEDLNHLHFLSFAIVTSLAFMSALVLGDWNVLVEDPVGN